MSDESLGFVVSSDASSMIAPHVSTLESFITTVVVDLLNYEDTKKRLRGARFGSRWVHKIFMKFFQTKLNSTVSLQCFSTHKS